MQLPQWLLQVDKPARYTGGEYNQIVKDPAGKVRFVLAYPDVYEIGMSHIGSRILYEALNAREDTYCERAYTPWPDARREMESRGESVYALETGDPLKAFDIIGFSLLYELTYSNVVNVLKLSGIPSRACDRDDSYPLIVAGGPCAYNCEPVAPFLDAVMLGDGEESICELAQVVADAKREGWDKQTVLTKLAGLEGFYIPSFYDVSYHADGRVAAIAPRNGAPAKVKKRVVRDLDGAVYPTKPIVPYMSIIHDRGALELFRGCTRGCRFCQAGYVYRPVRERKLDTLCRQACDIIRNTGYDEISLTSLSSGDYSELQPLIDRLSEAFDGKSVSLSLPSLRIDSYLKSFAEGTAKVRKGGLTFAPEAGTQRMRDIINKGVTEEDLLRSVTDAFAAGYTTIKLYFMIGLPYETDEDILGIADLAKKVVDAYYALPREMRTQPPSVTVSVSPFVPKPFTPFQWEGQNSREEIARKQQLLKERIRTMKRVRFSTHDARVSFLEAVFARGDRRLADAIERACALGAQLDGWDECFNLDIWLQAFQDTGIDPTFYANRERPVTETMPFAHMDTGISEAFLLREKERAQKQAVTPDCRKGCQGCGLMEICGVQA